MAARVLIPAADGRDETRVSSPRGRAAVSAGPGLGVEPDRDFLRRHAM